MRPRFYARCRSAVNRQALRAKARCFSNQASCPGVLLRRPTSRCADLHGTRAKAPRAAVPVSRRASDRDRREPRRASASGRRAFWVSLRVLHPARRAEPLHRLTVTQGTCGRIVRRRPEPRFRISALAVGLGQVRARAQYCSGTLSRALVVARARCRVGWCSSGQVLQWAGWRVGRLARGQVVAWAGCRVARFSRGQVLTWARLARQMIALARVRPSSGISATRVLATRFAPTLLLGEVASATSRSSIQIHAQPPSCDAPRRQTQSRRQQLPTSFERSSRPQRQRRRQCKPNVSTCQRTRHRPGTSLEGRKRQ